MEHYANADWLLKEVALEEVSELDMCNRYNRRQATE